MTYLTQNSLIDTAQCLKNKIESGEGVDEFDWQAIVDMCDALLWLHQFMQSAQGAHLGKEGKFTDFF